MDWVTTSTILERMKSFGDQSIWDQFHARFRRPLLAYARKWGLSDAEAEDVTQEVLAAFAEGYKAGKYDRAKGRLNKWLFGIAYTQIANRRRRLGREAQHQHQAGESFWEDVPGEQEAEKVWDADWESGVLEECLRQVKTEVAERTFEAFVLTVRQGRPADDVARELNMSREAVYVAKHRVLKRLAERMQEYEHFQ